MQPVGSAKWVAHELSSLVYLSKDFTVVGRDHSIFMVATREQEAGE